MGHWRQLQNGQNVYQGEIKKKTFELFRQDSLNIEILTYDELFERAKYIVDGDKPEPSFRATYRFRGIMWRWMIFVINNLLRRFKCI